MRSWIAVFGALMFAAGAAASTWWQPPVAAQGFTVVQDCGAGASPQLSTTLYFGTSKQKGGEVSELEWQLYLRDEVTRRFPDGLTVWNAAGQWKNAAGDIAHEGSKVLLLVHSDTPAARQSVQQLIAEYRKQFDQKSVLWESSRVCVAF
jgi:hypothetical protein